MDGEDYITDDTVMDIFSDEAIGEATVEVAAPDETVTETVEAPIPTVEDVDESVHSDIRNEEEDSDEDALAKADTRYRELQAQKDREVAEAKAEAKAYKEMMESTPEEIDEPVVLPSEDELTQAATVNPSLLYQWTLANAQSMMPKVIAKIGEVHGAEMAESARAHYADVLAEEKLAPIKERLSENDNRASTEYGILHGVALVAEEYGEEFDALRGEVMESIKQNANQFDNWTDPDAVKNFVEFNLLRVHRAKIAQQAASPERPTGSVPRAERGTPGRAPKVSDEDAIADSIVNAFSSGRYE